MRIPGFEEGLLSILTNSIVGIAEKTSAGVMSAFEGGGSTLGSSNSLREGDGFFASLGEKLGFGGNNELREAAPTRAVVQEVTPKALVRPNDFHIDACELGTLSAPSFGSCSSSLGGHTR